MEQTLNVILYIFGAFVHLCVAFAFLVVLLSITLLFMQKQSEEFVKKYISIYGRAMFLTTPILAIVLWFTNALTSK